MMRAFTVILLVLLSSFGAQAQIFETAPPSGGSSLVSTFGDWELRCAGEKQCFISQVAYSNDGRPVMSINIRKLPEPRQAETGTLVAVNAITTPLSVFLPEGIALSIDTVQAGRAAFTFCHDGGCVSTSPLSEQIVDAMKKGGVANFAVRFLKPEGDAVESMPISLTGFTAAYGALAQYQ
jgi:invasion protein IalB